MRVLGALLSENLTTDEKLDIMVREYKIPIEENLREETDAMCNLGQGIEEKGIKKGLVKGIELGETKIILNMYKNGFTAEQIAAATDKELEEVKNILAERGNTL